MHNFVDIVGPDHARQEGEVVAVCPANTEEVSAVMKLCAARNLTVSAQGGGTKPWGLPIVPSLRLYTTRICGIREHSWQDLTATVAAGTTWDEFQRTLAKQGQQVALDALSPQHATVGGVLATNDSGLLRMKYGSLRDLVLGMTIVLADGTIARTGGKVVKNVAGYDLPKLLTGSFGTLGIITEATFRLHPLPKCTSTFTVRSTDIVPLADLMTALLKAGMLIERMQLRTETLAFALDVQFAAMREVLHEHGERLHTLAAPLSVEVASDDIFHSRERLFAADSSTVLKVTCLPTKLAAITAGIAQLAQMSDHAATCVADPVGIVTVQLSAPTESVALVIADLRERLLATGGTVVVLQPGELPTSIDRWGPAPAAIDVMRAVKHEFDPQRLLNPGVFVGGI